MAIQTPVPIRVSSSQLSFTSALRFERRLRHRPYARSLMRKVATADAATRPRARRRVDSNAANQLDSSAKPVGALVVREQINEFVKRHNLTWELSLAGLAVAYLWLSFTSDSGGGAAPWLIGLLAAVFLSEFSVRFWAAPSRVIYLRTHWLDLVSCIPLIGGLRSFRLLRLLRLGAALRILALADHAVGRAHGDRQSAGFLAPLLIVIWLSAAVAYWTFEHGINPAVHNFGDALYWAGITATTVGYGDVTPVTTEGRILSGALIFLGIGLIGFASARLTTRWLKVDDGASALSSRISSLENEIFMLRGWLVARHGPDRGAWAERQDASDDVDKQPSGGVGGRSYT